jgi:hypothetical protein
MKSTLVLFFALILTSCAVFDKYDDNKHTWYHKSLTKEEKEKLKTEDYITKNWIGKNSNGDFSRGRLVILSVNKPFEFIETGTWTERHTLSASKGWRAILTDSTVYDATGNIIFKEAYMNENKEDKGPYLYEKWTSALSDSLRQSITLYYPNGQIKSFEECTIINYLRVQADNQKQKRITFLETFLENGQKCNPSDVTYDQWYEPGVRMSKH